MNGPHGTVTRDVLKIQVWSCRNLNLHGVVQRFKESSHNVLNLTSQVLGHVRDCVEL